MNYHKYCKECKEAYVLRNNEPFHPGWCKTCPCNPNAATLIPDVAANASGFMPIFSEAPKPKPTLKVMLDHGVMPTRAHPKDAGLDLYATKGGWILPKCRRTFGTGAHIAIPAGHVGLLTSKSGLMLKGITSRGTIDSDYTGEIRAVLFNHSWRFIRIKPHQKVSQLVILPIITPELELAESLDETERGDGGFGSTGAF